MSRPARSALALVGLVHGLVHTGCRTSDALLSFRDAGGDAPKSCASRAAVDGGRGLPPDLVAGLIAWYPFEGATNADGTLIPDATSHGHDGTLMASVAGIAGSQGAHFAAGKIGNALNLVAANKGYVRLPAGLLSDACEATLASWVFINSNVNAWTRIWDLGRDTTSYMFLTPINNINDVARFGISVNGNGHEETLNAQGPIPTLTWAHVALVLGPVGARLYVNGAVVGSNDAIALRPADLGGTVNNYLGRSQFADDPYLDGDLDELRIYDRALSAEEITALATTP